MRWIFIAAIVVSGCAKAPNIVAIKANRYDAELDLAFRSAKVAVAAKRSVVQEDPAAGTLWTDWEAIEVYGPPRTPRTSYRVRFEIALLGPKPWRIQVTGVIEGASTSSPTWLALYEDRIHADVHESLKAHLVRR